MEKKTSSVEWLFNEIAMPEYGEPPKWVMDILQQAKEMHEKQMEDIWDYARNVGIEEGQYPDEESRETFKQYYNETYGSTKQD